MEPFLSDFTRGLNIVLTVAMAVIALCVLLAQRTWSSAYASADRFSMGVRLPYGSEQTRDSIATSLRSRSIAVSLAILAASLLAAALLATPLATTTYFIFLALLPALVLGSAVGVVSVSVRERLFHPAPEAIRIARPREMHTADYLDPMRRVIPWALAGAACCVLVVLALVWVRASTQIEATAAAFAFVAGGVALFLFTALPRLERLVLSQPQPASHSLELAWDDALRTATLSSLRLSGALGAWFALSLGIIALVNGATATTSLITQLPTWGLIALQFVYPATGRRLPAPLYPEWLRKPAAMGGSL